MKKILVFLLIVIICFSSVACGRSRGVATSDFSNFQNEGTSEPNSNTTEVGSSTTESVLMEEPGIIDCVSVSKSVTVKRCEYDYKKAENKTNVKIYYPQIDGMVDLDIQTQINTLLKEEGLNDYSNRWNIENLTLEVDYSIVYINEKYMSVKFYGTGDADSYPTNLGYAINIDLSTGDRISLEEIVDIDGFLKILSTGKGYLEIENDFILEDYTYQELTKQYQNDDKDELAVPGYNTFYFTADRLGIYIYFPHAFGDYRTIEVDFKDIRSNVRNNDMFWKSISDTEKEETTKDVDASEYILPESDSRYYTREGLNKLADSDLRLARNEIFARHGRSFTSDDLQFYFATKTWYVPRYTPEEFEQKGDTIFNEFEQANQNLIVSIEQQRVSEDVFSSLTFYDDKIFNITAYTIDGDTIKVTGDSGILSQF